MKKTIIILLLLTAVFIFPVRCYAQTDADEIITDAGGNTDGYETQSLISHAFSLIFGAFSETGKSVLGHCAAILALCVTAGLINTFKHSFPVLGDAGEYISILLLSGTVFSAVNSITKFVAQATLRFSEYLLTLLPVMTSMYVYGGSTGAAVSNATSINLFCTVITVICNTVLAPLVNICLLLALTSALPGCSSVQPISGGVKNLAATLTAFVFSVLGFAVSLQTVVSAAGDSYATRTIRFASGVFIPVIGNMVGEASRTVISAVAKAKSVIGLGGIAAVMTIVIPPVITVMLYKIGILLCAAAARILGCEKEAAFLYDINGIFGLLFAVMLGSAMVGLLAITVFVCVGAPS